MTVTFGAFRIEADETIPPGAFQFRRIRVDDCADCQQPDNTCPGHPAPNRKQRQ